MWCYCDLPFPCKLILILCPAILADFSITFAKPSKSKIHQCLIDLRRSCKHIFNSSILILRHYWRFCILNFLASKFFPLLFIRRVLLIHILDHFHFIVFFLIYLKIILKQIISREFVSLSYPKSIFLPMLHSYVHSLLKFIIWKVSI